jgi:alpha-amylase/alpha-mannosidase (GH57 family)
MELWHMASDTPRIPLRVGPGDPVTLHVGTWPIAPGQSVWASIQIEGADGTSVRRVERGRWVRNDARNSHFEIELGRFRKGDRVSYTVLGEGQPGAVVATPARSFRVGPKAYLAILWHQHQPIYADPEHPSPIGSLRQPWVRLHALRDYYAMPALLADFEGVRLTFNLTGSLLRQIAAYVERGATDRALELTLRGAETIGAAEREELLAGFFDASWHHQILAHARYAELFRMRAEDREFSPQDLRDLQMWFNLAWFNPEFLERDVLLVTGEVVSVSRFVHKGRGFTDAEIEQMVAEQYKLLRAIVPIHRQLQDRGQIEVTTSPLHHPILPLLIDTDQATIDRPGTRLPRRFAHPEDADAQIAHAAADYEHWFGRRPRGMWPAEGAVSSDCIPLFARHGIDWIASDQGVLERSGKWGYAASDPDVRSQPYRLEAGEQRLSIFFRDHELSDMIGFSLQHLADPEQAAHELLRAVREGVLRRLSGEGDRLISIILDGENPWGAYAQAGRPFLRALYRLLEHDPELETTTFSDYLAGDRSRRIEPHPVESHTRLHDLYTGSWIDELGSSFGVDLGTWIGETEENIAWELLADARDALTRSGATPDDNPEAFDSIWIAEGSDWFWWFGADQDSGRDDEFDALFRARLRHAWRALGLVPPEALARRFVAITIPWSFSQKVERVAPGDRLVIRTNCQGSVGWRYDSRRLEHAELAPVGGVMAGPKRYEHVLGPVPEGVGSLTFHFRCTSADCDHAHPTCRGEQQRVVVDDLRGRARAGAVPRQQPNAAARR